MKYFELFPPDRCRTVTSQNYMGGAMLTGYGTKDKIERRAYARESERLRDIEKWNIKVIRKRMRKHLRDGKEKIYLHPDEAELVLQEMSMWRWSPVVMPDGEEEWEG